mmetsp:Transcript_18899/g.64977  ORF Transcript_18899/g.64977 Transcript_18899/m.64977 type:complete len:332 (+) Transcript_18899:513-1508(+)
MRAASARTPRSSRRPAGRPTARLRKASTCLGARLSRRARSTGRRRASAARRRSARPWRRRTLTAARRRRNTATARTARTTAAPSPANFRRRGRVRRTPRSSRGTSTPTKCRPTTSRVITRRSRFTTRRRPATRPNTCVPSPSKGAFSTKFLCFLAARPLSRSCTLARVGAARRAARLDAATRRRRTAAQAARARGAARGLRRSARARRRSNSSTALPRAPRRVLHPRRVRRARRRRAQALLRLRRAGWQAVHALQGAALLLQGVSGRRLETRAQGAVQAAHRRAGSWFHHGGGTLTGCSSGVGGRGRRAERCHAALARQLCHLHGPSSSRR